MKAVRVSGVPAVFFRSSSVSDILTRVASDSLIGRTLVGHRIEALLGEGGMGVVYRARHERLNKVRALKLLPPQLARDEAFRDRFEREWRLAASIEHASIVEVIDAGETGDHLYILMRLVDGPDLAKLVKEEGPLSPERTLDLLEQIGAALDAAHSQGLVHRDVTPRNILVAAGDRAYLADFGVARTTATRGLTRTGYFVGNLDYAAPEQIDGTSIDGRVDVYALGGVFFTSVTGCAPYDRESDVQLMYAQLNDPPPAPSTIRRELPQALDAVLAKAMAKSRDDRYASCAEFVEAARAAMCVQVREAVPVGRAGTTVDGPAAQIVEAGLGGNGAPGKVELGPEGALAEGEMVGGYKIERRLGGGGMGVVYLAERPRLGSKVALKILPAHVTHDSSRVARFQSEARAASRRVRASRRTPSRTRRRRHAASIRDGQKSGGG